MKSKKWLSIVLMAALLIIAYPGLAFSTTPTVKNQVTFQADEITNRDILRQRAINGVSDYKGKMNQKATVTDPKTNIKKDVEVISTTQLLEITETSNGVIQKKYATTSFALLKASDLLEASDLSNTTAAIITCDVFDNSALFRSNAKLNSGYRLAGSHGDSGFDSSWSVEAYNCFYWTNSWDGNGLEYSTLNSGNGYWQIDEPSLYSSSNHSYRFIQIGWIYGGAYQEYKSSWTSCGTSFSGYAPTNWSPIHIESMVGFGVAQKCNVTRKATGTTWYFEYFDDIGNGI